MKRAKTGRGTPRSGCVSGKVQFDNEVRANEALDRIRDADDRRFRGGKPTRAYQCEKCAQWHLTARPYAPRWEQR